MSLERGLSLLAILALSNAAYAQHPAHRGGAHAGGGAVHPGQQHMMQGGHQVSPQQHQMMMHQQMWNEQMMFEEIMRSRGGGSRRQGASSQSAGGQRQNPSPGNNRPQTSAKQKQNGLNSAQPSAKHNQEKQAQSPGVVGKQAKQESAKEAKAKEAAASKAHKEQVHELHRNEAKKATVAAKHPQSSDQMSISLLRTSLRKMSEADHDYAGHRVEAMRHAARALDHLTGSYAFNNYAVSGAGNLPQAQSDRLLREAEGHLRFIESRLGTTNNHFEHHQNARASVGHAIHELRIALRIN